ncbi:hypothetical protein [Kitasatospora sp. GAS1066B]|uniref:hypothetical protein n=1 Tax=Kitasatospora sp. GAS1066B TaxID=3156271 RepID=UPI0035135844
MRLRHSLGAALGALALTAALPMPAHADNGYLAYKYGDPLFPKQAKNGTYPDNLTMPEAVCIEIPEVENKPLQFAWAPSNHTASYLYVFTEEECLGVKTKVEAGQRLGSNIKFKSIYQP